MLTWIPRLSLVSDGGLTLSLLVNSLAYPVSGGEGLTMHASHWLRVCQKMEEHERRWYDQKILNFAVLLDLVNSFEPNSNLFQASDRQIILKAEPKPRKVFQSVALKCNQQLFHVSCRLCQDSTLGSYLVWGEDSFAEVHRPPMGPVRRFSCRGSSCASIQ